MSASKYNKIILFDFDGTLIKGDSLYRFLIHCNGLLNFIITSLLFIPTYLLFKTGVIDRNKAKEKLVNSFLNGMDKELFDEKCNSFQPILYSLLRPNAISAIEYYKSRNCYIVIITASIENYIKPFADNLGVDYVIATKLKSTETKIDGHFETKNCYGIEKLKRIAAEIPWFEDTDIITYGDSKGDLELLKISSTFIYRSLKLVEL